MSDGSPFSNSLPQALPEALRPLWVGTPGYAVYFPSDFLAQSIFLNPPLAALLAPAPLDSSQSTASELLTPPSFQQLQEALARCALPDAPSRSVQLDFAGSGEAPRSFEGILTPYREQDIFRGAWAMLLPTTGRSDSQHFHTIFNQPNVGIAFCSVEGALLRVNEAFVNILGYPDAKLDRLDFPSLLSDKAEAARQILRRLQSIEIRKTSFRGAIQSYDQGAIPCEIHFSGVEDESGDVEEILLSVKDLSETFRSHEALQRSEARFRSLFEKAPFPIGVRDMESNRIVDANEALKDVFGAGGKNTIGMHRSEYIHSEDSEHEAILLKQLVDKEIPSYTIEKVYNHGNGSLYYAIMTRILLEMDNKQYAVAFLNDITQFKAQEDVLEAQNAQLQLINDRLDRFVYSATHELRAPLTSIQGLISLIRAEGISEEVDNYLALQEQSLTKLDSYLRKIVLHSDNNNSELSVTAIDLKEMIRELYTEMSNGSSGIPVEKHIIDGWEGAFYSDPARVRTVVQNILANAATFHDPGKSQCFVKTYLESHPQGVRIRVEDNGIGIAPAIQPKVFDMLFRGSVRSTGSGMGLFIADEVVKKLGGQIHLESNAGRGSVFTVELPSLVPPLPSA